MNIYRVVAGFVLALGLVALASAIAWAAMGLSWWAPIETQAYRDPARGMALWALHAFFVVLGIISGSWWLGGFEDDEDESGAAPHEGGQHG
jgi:H+/Cl- antiporter ClcA